jgi:hypothetical protein
VAHSIATISGSSDGSSRLGASVVALPWPLRIACRPGWLHGVGGRQLGQHAQHTQRRGVSSSAAAQQSAATAARRGKVGPRPTKASGKGAHKRAATRGNRPPAHDAKQQQAGPKGQGSGGGGGGGGGARRSSAAFGRRRRQQQQQRGGPRGKPPRTQRGAAAAAAGGGGGRTRPPPALRGLLAATHNVRGVRVSWSGFGGGRPGGKGGARGARTHTEPPTVTVSLQPWDWDTTPELTQLRSAFECDGGADPFGSRPLSVHGVGGGDSQKPEDDAPGDGQGGGSHGRVAASREGEHRAAAAAAMQAYLGLQRRLLGHAGEIFGHRAAVTSTGEHASGSMSRQAVQKQTQQLRHLQRGLEANDAVQHSLRSVPICLGLHFATAGLSFPSAATEPLRLLRDALGSDSWSAVGVGHSPAEAQCLALEHAIETAFQSTGLDLRTRQPGLGGADVLSAEADAAAQLLDCLAFRPPRFQSLGLRKGSRGQFGAEMRLPLKAAYPLGSSLGGCLEGGTGSGATLPELVVRVQRGRKQADALKHAVVAGAEALLAPPSGGDGDGDDAQAAAEAADAAGGGVLEGLRARRDLARQQGRRVLGLDVPPLAGARTQLGRRIAALREAFAEPGALAAERGGGQTLSTPMHARGGGGHDDEEQQGRHGGQHEAAAAAAAADDEALRAALVETQARMEPMQQQRAALPIAALQAELLSTLAHSPVVVVSGGTGSGKSTQIPQYLLDDAIQQGSGRGVNIVVTQPRRLAAVSVATRVAAERGEQPGTSVGYRVRHRSVRARRGGATIEFCTTGVLLRQLQSEPRLEGVSHVIIDEVHERDISTDFLLVLMKDLLRLRPGLRLILMSATLDARSISEYFGGAPLVEVPSAPRYPVEEIYLEDLLHAASSTGRRLPPQASQGGVAARPNAWLACQWETQQLEAAARDAIARPGLLSADTETTGEQGPDMDDAEVGAADDDEVAMPPSQSADSAAAAVTMVQSIQSEHRTLMDELLPTQPPHTDGRGRGRGRGKDNKPSERAVYAVAADLCVQITDELLAGGGSADELFDTDGQGVGADDGGDIDELVAEPVASGSILVFLPGMEQIKAVTRLLDGARGCLCASGSRARGC